MLKPKNSLGVVIFPAGRVWAPTAVVLSTAVSRMARRTVGTFTRMTVLDARECLEGGSASLLGPPAWRHRSERAARSTRLRRRALGGIRGCRSLARRLGMTSVRFPIPVPFTVFYVHK